MVVDMHGSLPDEAERPLPLTERGCRTRASIVDAAATLMYQRGVCATSLDDVLAAAGSGKSQLYQYFADKADLVAAVIERQLENRARDLQTPRRTECCADVHQRSIGRRADWHLPGRASLPRKPRQC